MIGQTISHYRILEKLGGGGMGVVYKAEDTRLERSVALKFLPERFFGNQVALERFRREAKAASALDHPNICTVHEIGESDEGELFIAMGYYGGETLSERLRRGPMPIEEALGITAQVARGLSKAHEMGIVHRDVKPANLKEREDGLWKILDFGIAARLDRGDGEKVSISGTPFYMAPEQIQGQPPTPATDIYAFGATAFHLATGRPPFHTGNVIDAHLNTPPPDPLDLVSELDPELGRIILRCMEKDPKDRFADTGELCAALEPLCR